MPEHVLVEHRGRDLQGTQWVPKSGLRAPRRYRGTPNRGSRRRRGWRRRARCSRHRAGARHSPEIELILNDGAAECGPHFVAGASAIGCGKAGARRSDGRTIRFIQPQAESLTELSGYARAGLPQPIAEATSYEMGAALGGPIIQDELGFRVSASAPARWRLHRATTAPSPAASTPIGTTPIRGTTIATWCAERLTWGTHCGP